MKTKNNVQKTNFKTVVLLTCLALTGITVNAQAYMRSISYNTNFNGNAVFMASNTKMVTTAISKVEVSKNEAETPLKLESWMIGTEFFRAEMKADVTVKELPLELENWMHDDSAFMVSTSFSETEKEFPLELENWMTSENFGNRTVNEMISEQSAEKETTLELETWMLASSYWK